MEKMLRKIHSQVSRHRDAVMFFFTLMADRALQSGRAVILMWHPVWRFNQMKRHFNTCRRAKLERSVYARRDSARRDSTVLVLLIEKLIGIHTVMSINLLRVTGRHCYSLFYPVINETHINPLWGPLDILSKLSAILYRHMYNRDTVTILEAL